MEASRHDREDARSVAEAAFPGDEIVQLVEPARVAMKPPVPGDLRFVAEVVDEDDVLEFHAGPLS